MLSLLLLVLAVAQAITFERVEIDANPPRDPWIKVVADLDGDRAPDIAIGGARGPLVWYRAPSWSKSVIAEGGYDSVDGEACDLDRDGDLDLVIGGVLWYENTGRPGAWPAHRIARHRTHDVEVGDLDRDGRIDVVVRGQSGFGAKEGHRILMYRQLAPGRWESRELRCPEGEGLKLADVDGDRDLDIVIAARWYENPAWTERVYSTAWTYGDATVDAGDVNGDGRLDIVLAPAEYKGGVYRIAWFEGPRKPTSAAWTGHTIEPRIETVVHSLRLADCNGDRSPDLVAARMHQGAPPQEVSVYWNQGRGLSWSRQVLSTRGSHGLVVADLDGNGVPDVVGANHGGPYQPVELWRGLRRSGR